MTRSEAVALIAYLETELARKPKARQKKPRLPKWPSRQHHPGKSESPGARSRLWSP